MASERIDVEVDWQSLLEDLANLSATGYRLVDSQGRKIAEAGEAAPICQIVQKSEVGRRYCEQHCWSGIPLVDPIYSHSCRTQIRRIVLPVAVGGRLIGYLLCGGGRRYVLDDEVREVLGLLEAEVGVPRSELIDAYNRTEPDSPTQVGERRRSLGQLLAQKVPESMLLAAIRSVRRHATEADSSSLWGRLANAIRFVISPESDFEIFIFAPARDVVDRVWPEQDWNGSDRYEDFRLGESGTTQDEQGRLVVTLRSKNRLLGAIRARSSQGKPFRDVTVGHLQQLAAAIADALMLRRERKAQEIIEDLDPELRQTSSYHERLQIILERCKKELRCDDGEVVLRTTDKVQRLRIIAHTGLETDDLRLSLHAGGVIGERILKMAPAVVTDTMGDEDFQLTLKATEHHKALKAFREHLGQIGAFVKLPMSIGGEVLGVLDLHRRAPGLFPLGLVHVLEIVAERAAVEAACILASEQAAQTASRNASRNKRLRQAIEGEGPEALLKRVERLPAAQARHTLLEHLSETASIKSEAYRTAVCLVDPDCTKVAVEAKKGEWPESMCMEILFSDKNSAVIRAIHDGKTYRVPDVHALGVSYMRNEPDRTRSTVAILLKYGTHTLGVLNVEWDETDAFDNELVSGLELLAERYSWVIKRFDVDQQMVKLDSILPRLAIDPQWEPDYATFLRAVAEMLDVGEGAVFIRDPGTGRYFLKGCLPSGQERVSSLWYEHGECITGWIIENSQPVKAENVWDPADLGRNNPALQNVPVRKPDDIYLPDDRPIAFLGVPINFANEVFGVLRLNIDARLRNFDATDQHIAMAAASRLANCLNVREQAKRTSAKLRLWSSIPEISDVQTMAEAVYTTLLQGIGECAAHIRMLDRIDTGLGPAFEVLHLVWSRSPEWLNDDDWTETGRPPWIGPSRYFTQSEGSITGKVWRDASTFKDLNVSDTSESGLLAERSPEFYKNVGALVLTPLAIEPERLEGTLHVYRKYHHSFSAMDIDFIEDVARIAAKGLVSVREKEMQVLELELRGMGDRFFFELLKGNTAELEHHERLSDRHDHLAILERDLLVGLIEILRAELGGYPDRSWIALPDVHYKNFRVLDQKGTAIAHVAPIPCATMQSLLGKDCFRLVFNITVNTEVATWLREWSEPYAEAYNASTERSQNTQTCLLGIEADNTLLAVITIISKNPHFISYLKAEKARDILRHIGKQMIAARESEQRKHNEEISRPVLMMGSMISVLEHEIRGPIDSMVNLANYWSRPRTPEDLEYIRETMTALTTELNTKVGDLVSCDASIQEKLPVSLNDVLRKTSDSIRSAWKIQRFPVELELPTQIHVRGASRSLQNAFRLVIKNSLEAINDKGIQGSVQVMMEASADRMCRVTIKDNGEGMTKATLTKILNPQHPYFSTKGGSGMGLRVAYSIICSHGGNLAIDSCKGLGTTVTITLPLHSGGTNDAADSLR
jgi:signal transduction histidine kinase/GAF domain-containing protein/ligand-binding sensor protein